MFRKETKVILDKNNIKDWKYSELRDCINTSCGMYKSVKLKFALVVATSTTLIAETSSFALSASANSQILKLTLTGLQTTILITCRKLIDRNRYEFVSDKLSIFRR